MAPESTYRTEILVRIVSTVSLEAEIGVEKAFGAKAQPRVAGANTGAQRRQRTLA
jgi:hypothetical protein